MTSVIERALSAQTRIEQHRYRNRGFISKDQYQTRSVATVIGGRKKLINVVTGTVSGRKTEKLEDGRTCIVFTLNVPAHNGPQKIQMHATGSSMLTIMRHPAKTNISVIRAYNKECSRYEMTSVATDEQKSQDISGLWVIRQSDIELDDNLSRLRRSQTLLSCSKFMSGKMVIIRTPTGKTLPIPKALLTRP